MKPAVAMAKEIMLCNLQQADITDGCLIMFGGDLCEVAISMFDDTTSLPSVIGLKKLLSDEIVTLDLNSNFYDVIQVLHDGSNFEFKKNLLSIKVLLPIKLQLPSNWQDVVLDSTTIEIQKGLNLFYGLEHEIKEQAVLVKDSSLCWLTLSKTTDEDDVGIYFEIQSYTTEILDTGSARYDPIQASTSGDIEVNDDDVRQKTLTAGKKQLKKNIADLIKEGWTQVL